MKIALLKAGVNPKKCLSEFRYKEFPLSRTDQFDRTHPIVPEGLVDYDLYIADIKELDFTATIVLIKESVNIQDSIKHGAVLLCFASEITEISDNLNNYSWLPRRTSIGLDSVINSSATDILTSSTFPFINLLEKVRSKFSSECIIKSNLGEMPYTAILTDKAERAVGLYLREGEGHIFILPRLEDKEGFIKFFISSILPTLYPLKLQLESTLPLKPPDYIKKYFEKIPGIKEIKKRIENLDTKIVNLKETRAKEELNKMELEKWMGLIWFKHIPLQRIIGDAFEMLGLEVERPPETQHGPDLIVRYRGKEVIIEAEGSANAIDIEKGRQLYEWLGKEDPAVQGVLVGNPFNELLIENRPPKKGQSLFTEALEKLAKSRGFSLVLSTNLFNLVCKKLKGEEISPQELMDRMYEGKGVIRLSF